MERMSMLLYVMGGAFVALMPALPTSWNTVVFELSFTFSEVAGNSYYFSILISEVIM
jgi:hypothetical protein